LTNFTRGTETQNLRFFVVPGSSCDYCWVLHQSGTERPSGHGA